MSLRETLEAARGRFSTRLVAGLLAASLPIAIVLAVVLTRQAAANVTSAAEQKLMTRAAAAASALDAWILERRGDMSVLAHIVSGREIDRTLGPLLGQIVSGYRAYEVVQVTDLAGRPLVSSDPERQFDPGGEEWFRSVAAGQRVISPLWRTGETLRWVVAEPVIAPDGRTRAVVMGDLDEARLGDLLGSHQASRGRELQLLTSDGFLAYSSEMGSLDTRELLSRGVLTTRIATLGAKRGLAGENGAARWRDYRGVDVLGGYAGVGTLGWAVVDKEPVSSVLSSVQDQRRQATLLVLAAGLLALVFAAAFARRTTRPLLRLTSAADQVSAGDLEARAEPGGSSELQRLASSFNEMLENLGRLISQVREASSALRTSAAELSASSEDLAATTSEQAAAVTETSATTEELSRTSASIADTIEGVATQAANTRESLEQAEADVQASSARTLTLAERVNEIGAILALLNDIADQTNLLALNAAIEAARAGEEGRGFAVVADEVRRLAERSKTSAGEIAVIIDGIQSETNATVMAMEKGAKEMQQGLGLLDQVAEVASEVNLSTRQQRSATSQLVDTMEQLTSASRQVSVTAQHISTAATSLAGLASNLEETAAQVGSRG